MTKPPMHYAEDGGRALIGKERTRLPPRAGPQQNEAGLLEMRQRNIYTIEKNGVKKLIYQSPWYHNGEYAGFIELILGNSI